MTFQGLGGSLSKLDDVVLDHPDVPHPWVARM